MRLFIVALIGLCLWIPALGQIRVLPLGNSITHGTDTHFSYRYNLWKKLTNEKVNIDFIGTMTTNYGGNPPFPDPLFDKHHEGHRGWRADQLFAGLANWLPKYTPDIVLLHAGKNDVFMGQTNSVTADETSRLLYGDLCHHHVWNFFGDRIHLFPVLI